MREDQTYLGEGLYASFNGEEYELAETQMSGEQSILLYLNQTQFDALYKFVKLIEKENECLHEESENGICSDCGNEVDWVSRKFKETERD